MEGFRGYLQSYVYLKYNVYILINFSLFHCNKPTTIDMQYCTVQKYIDTSEIISLKSGYLQSSKT